MLATAMTVHRYNVDDLMIGSMLSLPKDHKADICDSNNYKDICLCSCIKKLLEWCIKIDVYKRLKSRTSWNNVNGEYFNSISGV